MNSHILERIASEKNLDLMRSVEFFIAMAIGISIVGLVFIAVA